MSGEGCGGSNTEKNQEKCAQNCRTTATTKRKRRSTKKKKTGGVGKEEKRGYEEVKKTQKAGTEAPREELGKIQPANLRGAKQETKERKSYKTQLGRKEAPTQ